GRRAFHVTGVQTCALPIFLLGQGEMHLGVALERLNRKYGVEGERERRLVPYKETIRKGTTIRGRHKKQSGGHGQFGDVVLDIKQIGRASCREAVRRAGDAT